MSRKLGEIPLKNKRKAQNIKTSGKDSASTLVPPGNVVWQNGHSEWTPAERRLLQIITKRCETILLRGFQPRACWDNTAVAVLMSNGKALYCEGIVEGLPLVMRHSWCLINGKVWDMTLPLTCKEAKLELPLQIAYSGKRFSHSEFVGCLFHKRPFPALK